MVAGTTQGVLPLTGFMCERRPIPPPKPRCADAAPFLSGSWYYAANKR